jgi:DNA-binding HxlR family transcriptional regulator
MEFLGIERTDGPLRFYRLLERVEGVSQESLTATLSELERDGFVRRSITAQVPIRVTTTRRRSDELLVKFQHL